MGLRKRGRWWHWRKRLDGILYEESLRTTDRKIAEEKARIRELELQERGTLRPPRLPFEDLVEEYLKDAANRLRPSTLKRSRGILEDFLEHTHVTQAGRVNSEHVHRFLRMLTKRRKYAPSTVNRNLCTISAMFRWAIERGIVRTSPVAGIRLLPLEEKVPAFLEHDELGRLLAAARGTYLEVPVALGAYAGLRKGEMERLAWRDVDFGARVIWVRDTKGRRPRVVPLSDALRALLLRWRAGKEVGSLVMLNDAGRPFRHNLRTRLMALGRRAGVEQHVHAHLLRHTFASHLAMAGVSLWKIAKWLGHRNVQTTMIYAHFAPQWDEEVNLVGARHQGRAERSMGLDAVH